MTSRRTFLIRSAGALAGPCLPFGLARSQEQSRAAHSRHFEVAKVERVTVEVPYRDAPQRAMDRELPHWRYTEILTVTLKSGHRGHGETLLYYTWGATGDDDIARVMGRNAAREMWDDSLGAGLQMALFDAVARVLEVPVWSLLGKKAHEKTPLSWWNIDMATADMAAECRQALRDGYLSYKTKGRPWFDLWDQVETAAETVPPEFKIDMDFNSTLLDAGRAIPILTDLERYPQIDIYESPIPQADVDGNVRIREATRVNIALHYGTPAPEVVVREGVCDGFVVGGGASRVMEQGHFCGQAGMPFWLQLVGTGLTAAYSLHFGGALRQAVWPAVNCHQLYRHSLLTRPIVVKEGQAVVPNEPGIGYEPDWDQIEKWKIEKPESRPNPARLIETRWPDGRRMIFAGGEVNFMLNAANRAEMPFYERGVETKLLPDDGSDEWRNLHERARKGPVTEK